MSTAVHDCAERINESLAPHNSRLAGIIAFGRPTMTDFFQVVTVKTDPTSRKKPPALYASYCPFCGISLATPPASLAAQQEKP